MQVFFDSQVSSLVTVFESGQMMEVCFDKYKLSTKTFIHTEVFVSVYIPTSNTFGWWRNSKSNTDIVL